MQANLHYSVGVIGEVVLVLLVRHFPTGGSDDFQSPQNSEGIVGVQTGGGFRIQVAKTLIHIRQSLGGHLFLELQATGLVPDAVVEDAMEQGPDIQAGSPHYQRRHPAGMQVRQNPAALAIISRSIEVLIRKNHIHQVMWRQGPFLPGGLGSADIQFPVDLERVGIDNLRPQLLGQPDGQGGFSHSGGPGEDGHGKQGSFVRILFK